MLMFHFPDQKHEKPASSLHHVRIWTGLQLTFCLSKEQKVINSIGFICQLFAFLGLTADNISSKSTFCAFVCTKVNLKWHRETFSLATSESDISLAFQTCHNSRTDKIIDTLIDKTNKWDLQSDFLCSAEAVCECAALTTCTFSLWWALEFKQHLRHTNESVKKRKCGSGMTKVWVYVSSIKKRAPRFLIKRLERPITQLSRQPCAEGGRLWTEVTGCVRVCVGALPGTPVWLPLTSLQDSGGHLGKHHAPACFRWHSPSLVCSFTLHLSAHCCLRAPQLWVRLLFPLVFACSSG